MILNNEESSIDTDNKELFNDNIISIANEFKTLLTKMETEITDLRRELKTVRTELKEIQESDVMKPSLQKGIHAKVTFLKLIKCQATKRDIVFFIFAILGSLGAGCSMPLMSLLLGDVIDGFDASFPKEDVPGLIHGVIINFCAAGAAIFVGSLLMVIFWTIIGQRLSNAIKVDYFRVVMKQEQAWFDESNTFEFATKIQTQTKIIENGIGTKVGVALSAISQFLISFIIGYITSWKLSLVITAMLPLLGLGGWFMASAMKQGTAEMRTYEKAGGMAEEVLYQIKTVASFANYDYERKRYQEFLDTSVKAGIKQGYKSGFGIGFIIFVIYASYALAIGYGSKLISDPKEVNDNTGKSFGAGEVITVLFAIIFGCFSLGQAAPNIKAIYEACNAAQDYFDLKERKPKHSYNLGKETPPKNSLKGELELKNLSFKYPSVNKMVLNSINLLFEPGKKIAIVGPSGIGKSTILSLIERFYEPTSGTITFDGKNIRNFDLKYWRSLIGFVPQEPVLFNSTIRENIIFGRENITESEILAACKKAYATEIIEKCTLDYIVGVKGEKLSGGQRQRIAIARAILLQPKLLILDEATSALDNKSEKEVQKALDSVSQGITSIIIAHKIDTIKNSNKIFCFDKNGVIAEEGTHEELMEKNGVYAEHYKIVAKKEKDLRASLGLEAEEDNRKYDQEINFFNNTHGNNYMNISNSYDAPEKKKSFKQKTKGELNPEEIAFTDKREQSNKSIDFRQKNEVSFINKREGNSIIVENKAEAKGKDKAKEKEERKKEAEIFKKAKSHVFSIVKKYKCFIAGSAIFASLNGAVWPVYGILLAKAISVLSKEDLKEVKDDGLVIAFSFLALAISAGIVLWMQNYFFYGLGEILTNQYRREIYDKFLTFHIGYFDIKENSPGSLMTKLSTDTTKISGVATSIIGQLLQTSITLILGIVISLIYQWLICLINIAFMPLVIGSYVLQFKLQQGSTEGSKSLDEDAGNILSETVQNTKTIFSYNMETKIVDMYSDIVWEKKVKKRSGYLRLSINGAFYSLTQFVIFAMYATLFYVGGNLYKDGKASFEDIVTAIFTILFSALGVGIAQMFVGDYAAAKKAVINLQKILDTQSEIDVHQTTLSGIKKSKLDGKVEFRNVGFKYAGGASEVFKNLSFVVQPGQNVAFVGSSGSGKSTIISLIERFYDVSSGQILIDDINIKDYDLIELRKNIGIVLQQPALFNRTIKDNIRYGRLDCNEEDIETAATEANIIDKLKDDDTTEINVSGGEKQRIAIARAILKNPNILLLDEATSALDKENEELVQETLNKLMKGKTCIIVAHRLSTIIKCDKIFVLVNGEIVESGNHDELMTLNGKYAELYKGASES